MQDLIIYIYYMLWLANILCTIMRKNVRIISWMTIFLMFFIFTLNAATEGDAQIYKADYESGLYGDEWVEFGYIYIVSFFREIGITDFNVWLVCVFILTNMLFYKCVSRYISDFHPMFAVVMGYIWIGQTQGLRFYIAISIFFYGIYFLSEQKYKQYLIITLLASCIHRTILFMIMYPIFLRLIACFKIKGFIDKNELGKYIVCFSFFICSLFYVLQGLPLLENLFILISIFNAEGAHKLLAYGSSVTKWGGVAYILIYVIMLVGVVYVSNRLQKFYSSYNNRMISFVRNFFYVTAIICPLLVINIEFRRFLMVPTLLYGIMISIYNEETRKKCNKSLVLTFNSENVICALLFILAVLAWSMPTLLGMINTRITIESAVENLIIFH